MQFSESIFAVRFGITLQDLEKYLGEALSQGGDYADLYFEYLVTSSIGIDESMVKSAAQGISMGVGVRAISGERTGYAYSVGATARSCGGGPGYDFESSAQSCLSKRGTMRPFSLR